jgi:hypothetical protein
MSKHFDGFSKYTASKRPWRLVYFEKVQSRSEALKREKDKIKEKSHIHFQFIYNKCYQFGWVGDYVFMIEDEIQIGYGSVWGKDNV